MNELIAFIAPLLVVDLLNPVLFAVLLFAASGSRPILNCSALLLGHTLAYFFFGIGVSFGVSAISERLANPMPVDFGIEFVLGLACLYAILPSRNGGASEPRNPETEFTPMKALAYGAVVNLIGAPFALPYFAVVSQIMGADLTLNSSLLVLAAYNLAYALPFAMVPILLLVMGDRAKPLLQSVNNVLVKGADMLMPLLMLLLGTWLIVDSVYYFVTGTVL